MLNKFVSPLYKGARLPNKIIIMIMIGKVFKLIQQLQKKL